MGITAYSLALLAGVLLARWLPGTYILTAIAAILISLILASKKSGQSTRDVYQLDHAVLNIQPPKTMWLNMGYWKDTKSFPEACEGGISGVLVPCGYVSHLTPATALALARKLGRHANIQPNERILDIGCGCGSSVVLWATEFKASEVVAVTSVPSHIEQAKRAVDNTESIPYDTKIDLQIGDAVEFTRSQANKGEKYDRVIALDCAYHFQTRKEFLKQVEGVLEFTGTIGLTDLMLPDTPLSPISSVLMRIICFFANVPFDNLVNQAEYEQTFREIGFTQLEVEDVTQDVFPGLAEYIESRDKDPVLRAALDPAKLQQYRMFAKVLKWWSGGRLRFVLVKAMKGIKQ